MRNLRRRSYSASDSSNSDTEGRDRREHRISIEDYRQRLLGDNFSISASSSSSKETESEMGSYERQKYESRLENLRHQIAEKDRQVCLYQAQLSVWLQDFKQERQDREKAQARVAELEMELATVKELMAGMGEQRMQSAQKRREEAIINIGREYFRSRGCQPSSNGAQISYRNSPRGIVVSDGASETLLTGDEDIIDSLVEADMTSPSHTASSSDSSDLECPRCSRGFPVDQHSAFLEHIDICV